MIGFAALRESYQVFFPLRAVCSFTECFFVGQLGKDLPPRKVFLLRPEPCFDVFGLGPRKGGRQRHELIPELELRLCL